MKAIEINKENMKEAIASAPPNTPIFMLNLLRYKEKADYSKHIENEFSTGREAYFKGYIPAFNKVAANIPGMQPLYIGNAIAGLVAPGNETWDNVALIEYADFDVFRLITQSSEYLINAAPHRLAALEDWRLIVTVKMNLG